MNLKALSIPDSVLESAEFVMTNAQHVHIDETALVSLRQPIKGRLEKGVDSVEDAFGTTGSLDGDINLIFFETAANFCFWAQSEAEKWQTEFDGELVGGWYGLSRVFYKAVQNGLPVSEARFMESLTLTQASEIFAGKNGAQIPLIEQRVNNIVETATFLNRNYHGSGRAFLEDCDMSAPKIAEALVRHLPSYRDGAWFKDRWIWILKRAQILASDLSQLSAKYPEFEILGTDKLTAFADYRLPQVLRYYGVLGYSDSLAKRIDKRAILPAQSHEEIEIRAATIVSCEQLKVVCGGLASAEVDLGLWLLSQDVRNDPNLQPHHLTVSGYY